MKRLIRKQYNKKKITSSDNEDRFFRWLNNGKDGGFFGWDEDDDDDDYDDYDDDDDYDDYDDDDDYDDEDDDYDDDDYDDYDDDDDYDDEDDDYDEYDEDDYNVEFMVDDIRDRVRDEWDRFSTHRTFYAIDSDTFKFSDLKNKINECAKETGIDPDDLNIYSRNYVGSNFGEVYHEEFISNCKKPLFDDGSYSEDELIGDFQDLALGTCEDSEIKKIDEIYEEFLNSLP